MATDAPVRTRVRFAAGLPWIGPVLGSLEADGKRWIGAASDPMHGQPLAALFVPVRVASERRKLVPVKILDNEVVDDRGKAVELAEVARLAWFRSDSNGRFRVRTKVDGLPQGVGTLLVLLYDRSGALLDVADDQRRRFSPARWQSHAATAIGEEPLGRQRGEVRDEVVRRVRELFAMKSDQLEAAIVRPPAPLGKGTRFTFAVASCQYPAGFLDRCVAEASHGRLAKRLAKDEPVRCLLLVGDQIYSDATAGLFDPRTQYDRYDLPHERLLRGEALRAILRRIPLYAMLDDHEIKDNWEPLPDAKEDDEALIEGRRAYLGYQRIAGPEQKDATADSPNPLWYDFEVDGFHFFMADTRTERRPRTVETLETTTIMSPTQFAALLGWLSQRHAEERERPKFIASPACLLPRHRRARQGNQVASALQSDSWSGYRRSLHELLAHITENEMHNVVFLSGDEHISFDANITVTELESGRKVSIRSIHSSGLYSPFPFGNSIEEHLADGDTFGFEAKGKKYNCHVKIARPAPGDGFALVHATLAYGTWTIAADFDR